MLKGLGLLAAAGAVLGGEAVHAAKRTYLSPDSAPPIEGTFDAYVPVTPRPVRIVMIGDSTAAGIGSTVTTGSVGGHLASLLQESGVSVELSSVAISGSQTEDLGPQVSRALMAKPDLAVVLIGANDATHLASIRGVRKNLGDALDRLKAADVGVVVGTCPDLDAAYAFLQPLRAIAGFRGRQIASAERGVIEKRDLPHVDIAAETGDTIRNDPDRYLSVDRLHPNDEGYLLWAKALIGPTREVAISRAARPLAPLG